VPYTLHSIPYTLHPPSYTLPWLPSTSHPPPVTRYPPPAGRHPEPTTHHLAPGHIRLCSTGTPRACWTSQWARTWRLWSPRQTTTLRVSSAWFR